MRAAAWTVHPPGSLSSDPPPRRVPALDGASATGESAWAAATYDCWGRWCAGWGGWSPCAAGRTGNNPAPLRCSGSAGHRGHPHRRRTWRAPGRGRRRGTGPWGAAAPRRRLRPEARTPGAVPPARPRDPPARRQRRHRRRRRRPRWRKKPEWRRRRRARRAAGAGCPAEAQGAQGAAAAAVGGAAARPGDPWHRRLWAGRRRRRAGRVAASAADKLGPLWGRPSRRGLQASACPTPRTGGRGQRGGCAWAGPRAWCTRGRQDCHRSPGAGATALGVANGRPVPSFQLLWGAKFTLKPLHCAVEAEYALLGLAARSSRLPPCTLEAGTQALPRRTRLHNAAPAPNQRPEPTPAGVAQRRSSFGLQR